MMLAAGGCLAWRGRLAVLVVVCLRHTEACLSGSGLLAGLCSDFLPGLSSLAVFSLLARQNRDILNFYRHHKILKCCKTV
jgi:hypothetical protein